MSATRRPRRPGAPDAYYTPDVDAQACVDAILDDVIGRTVLEPHVGGGAFARSLLAAGADVHTMDQNAAAPGLVLGRTSRIGDFLGPDAVGGFRPHWTVGNPPFSGAEDHVRRAVSVSSIGAAFLLRLAFLESTIRRDFWTRYPVDEVLVLRQRPAFLELYEDGEIRPLRKRDRHGDIVTRKDGRPRLAGVDSAAYALFVWRHGRAAGRVGFIDRRRT